MYACTVRLYMCACWYSCVHFQALLRDSLYVNMCLDHFMVSLYLVDRMFIVCMYKRVALCQCAYVYLHVGLCESSEA